MSEGPGCGVNISFPERWNMITKAELKKQEALELTKRKAANQLAKKERAAAEQQYFDAKKLKGAAEPSSLVENSSLAAADSQGMESLKAEPSCSQGSLGDFDLFQEEWTQVQSEPSLLPTLPDTLPLEGLEEDTQGWKPASTGAEHEDLEFGAAVVEPHYLDKTIAWGPNHESGDTQLP